MLKFLQKVSKYRRVVLLFLFIPIVTVFFNLDNGLKLFPEDSFIRFKIEFYVPSKLSSEIEKKVTTIAEKTFNGLSNLISIESNTRHERSEINLIFDRLNDPNKILLFIQEKLDRLKITLPGDVKQIKVIHLKAIPPPDFNIKTNSGFNFKRFKDYLKQFNQSIKKIEPELDEELSWKIQLKPKDLLRYNISINQVWHSLKINGFASRLGSKNDLSYFVESNFDSLLQLKSTIIGAKSNTPIKLVDIANINLVSPSVPNEIKIWFNEEISIGKVEKGLKKLFPNSQIERVNTKLWISLVKKPLYFFALFTLTSFLIFYFVFQKFKAAGSVLVFNIGFFIHYLFWCFIFNGSLTILDFYSLSLGLIFGSFLWLVLLAKIRNTFYHKNLTGVRKTIQQSVLFALSELLSTYLILMVLLYLFSLPTLGNAISLPSTKILNHFFKLGIPIIFYFLTILSVFSPLDWATKEGPEKKAIRLFSRNVLIPPLIVLFIPISIYCWHLKPLGMKGEEINKEDFKSQLSSYRGHGHALTYLGEPGKIPKSYELVPSKFLEKEWINKWEVTPNGLRSLPKLDISSFKLAMEDIQQQKRLSFFNLDDKQSSSSLPIKLEQLVLDERNFSHLLVGVKSTGEKPRNLGHIAKKTVVSVPKLIFHEQINRVDQFYFKGTSENKSNFLNKPQDSKFKATSLTQFWRKHHKKFVQDHLTSFIFIFTFLSLYMNSFYRGWIITAVCLAQSGISSGILFLLKDVMPLDTLWLDNLPQWLSVAVILVLTRPMDIERLRGLDIEVALKNLKDFYARAVLAALILFSSGPLILGALSLTSEKMMPFATIFSQSSIFVGVLTLVLGLISYRFLFFSFYISSEKTIDGISLFLLKRFYIIKNGRLKKAKV
ncbi:efflux RND transporter permease subunit [Bacteriovoracales bacterium]|nr:efflux RND transporter permease subunit [Bacteriovoracales bacterium]